MPLIGTLASGGLGRGGGGAGPSLFPFTTFTFLPIVAAGSRVGPTLAQMQTAYAGQPWLSSYFTLGTYQGYQRWTVPQSRTYTIEAGGARGGDGTLGGAGSYTGVYGARIIGTFNLTSGDVLEIVVGSRGGNHGGAHGNENGGGGGTFVFNVTKNSLLIVAGGAGGSPSTSYSSSCAPPSVTNGQGQASSGVASFTCSSSVSAPTPGQGGNTAGSYQGGAGGGYLSTGANGGTHCDTGRGGNGYNNGLVGGTGNSCYTSDNAGGFGGGGGGCLGGPGAGGGYTGGCSAASWSSAATYGGGGGSFNSGITVSNTAGGNTGSLGGYAGAGYCKIT